MGVFDYKNMELFVEMGKCIQSGTEADFVRISDKIKGSPGITKFMGMGFMSSTLEAFTAGVLIPTFINAFAERYPDRFRRYDSVVFQQHIKEPLIKDIFTGSQTAYVLADTVLKKSDDIMLFTEMLQAAVLCENYSFFDYCIEHAESPSSRIQSELIYYLCIHKKYDSLDKIFKNTTREELLQYCRPKQEVFLDEIEYKLGCLYELCIRYLPEVRDSDDVPAAVSEFLDEADISDYLNIHPDFTLSGSIRQMPEYEKAWDFMKEHGLKFLSINGLAMSYFGYGNKDYFNKETIIKEKLMPLFADELYLDVLKAAHLQGNDQQGFERVLRLIGPERIYLDFTDSHIDRIPLSPFRRVEDTKELHIKQLLTVDMKVRIDDDIAHSKIANALISSAYLLEYVLDRTEVSDEQLMLLIDKCIKKKCFDSLNVIRRHLNTY